MGCYHDKDGHGVGLELGVGLQRDVVAAGLAQEREHGLRRRCDLKNPFVPCHMNKTGFRFRNQKLVTPKFVGRKKRMTREYVLVGLCEKTLKNANEGYLRKNLRAMDSESGFMAFHERRTSSSCASLNPIKSSLCCS